MGRILFSPVVVLVFCDPPNSGQANKTQHSEAMFIVYIRSFYSTPMATFIKKSSKETLLSKIALFKREQEHIKVLQCP